MAHTLNVSFRSGGTFFSNLSSKGTFAQQCHFTIGLINSGRREEVGQRVMDGRLGFRQGLEHGK